jgi:hypothetical protein
METSKAKNAKNSIEIIASLAPAGAELGLRLRLTNNLFSANYHHSTQLNPKSRVEIFAKLSSSWQMKFELS